MGTDKVNGASAGSSSNGRTSSNGVDGNPSQHPFTPLTSSEITAAAQLIKQLYPEDVELQYKTITLQEPNKADVIPFLVAEHEGRHQDPPPRRAFATYYIRNTVSILEIHVDASLIGVVGQIP